MLDIKRFLSARMALMLLFGLIALYTIYFSWYTINRHNTLNSYAADLSLITQPMWNTVRGEGGFMELTWGNQQQPRLAEHFEPILIPLSLLFFIWGDVKILLIAQSLALALGALPVFWVARRQFKQTLIPLYENATSDTGLDTKIASWVALVFSLAYLLYPQLQAANIADFHADPFIVTPLLFAFWYGTEKRWGWMWFWSILAMATKEPLPALTAMLGIYFIFYHFQIRNEATKSLTQSALFHGILLIVISVIWFLSTTYLIVSPLAQEYFGTDGPIYFESRYEGGLLGLISLLEDPARWHYLLGLFMGVGFLALLAPEMLILGAPVLAANFLSNFSGQYSGEQHYSAPLVVAFIIAAIYGVQRFTNLLSLRKVNGQPLRVAILIGASLWLLSWSVGYQAIRGWTPLSARTEIYMMNPVARQLPELIAQIPDTAVVSASPGIHPHLAHRKVAYVFPTIEEAEYLVVDVTDISGVHPNDVQRILMENLAEGWQVLEASHGLIFAQRIDESVQNELPSAFFDFTRTNQTPQHPTNITFGDDQLHLIGYDIENDLDDGVVVRFYWRATGNLPDDLKLWPLIYDDQGQLLSDPTIVPMIATVWYPPAQWQADEIIITETLPQMLPDTFHIGIAAGPNGSFANPEQRLALQSAPPKTAGLPSPLAETTPANPGRWMQLATLRRQGPFLEKLSPALSLQALTPLNIRLGSDIRLTGYWLDEETSQPGEILPIVLRWQAENQPSADFTVFIHLLGPDGSLISQSDAYPTWITPLPTSRWHPQQPLLDRHTLNLPSDLTNGLYTLQLGLYHATTLERLPLADGSDTVPLTQIKID